MPDSAEPPASHLAHGWGPQRLPRPLSGTQHALCEIHDVALLDLDGVVYIGPDAVPGAPDALSAARSRGMSLAFVTNNAARPPDAVADHLTRLGITAQADEVITSAQAAARYLSERLPSGAKVLVLGTSGLYVALRERGLVPVDEDASGVAAVVQGYSPEMNWALLAEGSVAIRRAAIWVATNVDPTVPSPRGPLPGNGSLVAALRTATGATPVVTGKPDPTMHRETLIRTGARTPIVVGDRLDTDIEGANAVGCPSMLVLSGVTTPLELLHAGEALRPTYIGADVSSLLQPQPSAMVDEAVATCGGWTTRRREGGLELSRSGSPEHASPEDDGLDALRALCAAAWNTDEPGSIAVHAADPESHALLGRLELAETGQ